MSNPATIREHIAFITAATLGITVHNSRFQGNPVKNLPAACVYFDGMEREAQTIGPSRSFFVDSTVVVEVHDDAGADEDVAKNMDVLAGALIPELERDRTLAGAAFHAMVEGYQVEISEEGDKPRGVARIEMNITWYEQQPKD